MNEKPFGQRGRFLGYLMPNIFEKKFKTFMMMLIEAMVIFFASILLDFFLGFIILDYFPEVFIPGWLSVKPESS